MGDLAFSKQIIERKDLFPWLKIFLDKIVKSFPNDFDKDTLQFLLQNIKKEVNSLSNEGDTSRKEALFEVIYDLFLHFWWRVHWDGKKKWRKYWKITYSNVSYSYDQRTKCLAKLLYFITDLGITLSNGCFESEWTEKVLKALHILPSFDDMICNSLLQINNLEEKYYHVYMAVLKHALCSEVAQNISEPVTYIKIILLLRRLKNYTKDKITLSSIKEKAIRMKAPSNTSDWLSSLEVNLKFKKHKNIAEVLLGEKCPENIMHRLYKIITGRGDSSPKADSHFNESEEMSNPKKVSDSEHIQPNTHLSRSMKESTVSWPTTNTPMTNPPSNNSKIKIRLNHKMLGGFITTPNSVELNQTESLKGKSKSKSISNKKECNEVTSIGQASKVKDFLSLSFAEISNFSEKSNIDCNELDCAKEAKDTDFVNQDLESGAYLPKNCMISPSKYKEKDVQCHKNSLSKRMKLPWESLEDTDFLLAEETFINNHETTKSNKAACLILPDNPDQTTQSDADRFYFELSDSNYYFSEKSNIDCNELDCAKEAQDTDFVNQGLESGAYLPKERLISPSKYKNKHVQCHKNSLDKRVKLPSKSLEDTEFLSAKEAFIDNHETTKSNEAAYLISPDNQDKTNQSDADRFYFELFDSNASTLKESLCTLQNTNSSTQHWDVPLQSPNKSTEIDFNLINSAIAGSNASSQNCSTENKYNTIGINAEELSSIELSAQELLNDLICSSQLDENKPIICNNRSDKNHLFSPTKSNCLTLNEHLTDSMKYSPARSNILQEDNVINKSTDGSICIMQDENASHCLVDCKIINDYNPNNSFNSNGPPSIKVFINVTCKEPKDGCNPQKEHIFGTFSDTSLKNVTSKSSVNYFNALNPFDTEKSNLKMPNLTPYFYDLPFQTRLLGDITTPPDSELDVSIERSIKKGNTEATTTIFTKKNHNRLACSTPKYSPSTLSGNVVTTHSNFRTPNTSECESSNEWSLENTNLINSLSLINSLQKSSADNVLKQLNSKTSFVTNKANTANSTSFWHQQNTSVSYRSNAAAIYSETEFSEDSTISCPSLISGSDLELKSPSTILQKSRKGSRDTTKKKTKIFPNKRKKTCAKQFKSKYLQEVSCMTANRYNLRSRGNLIKPNKLKDFAT